MDDTLDAWERPYFEPGGGDALIFCAVFGEIDLAAPLSRETYQCAGVPEGAVLSKYERSAADQAASLDQLRDETGYLWRQFEADHPDAAAAARDAPMCVLLRGEVADPVDLTYLRDVVGLIAWMLDHGGVAVYDPQRFEWWPGDAWRKKVFDRAEAAPLQHTIILTSAEDDTGRLWFHTRGMRKFGRPDISVRSVGPTHQPAIIELCERFIVHMAHGAVTPDGQAISMAALPPGGIVRHRGDLDDPDFNNVHIAIEWPGGALD